MQSFYSAKMGLKTQQQRMDVIAGNISNVSTPGYKSQSAYFRDMLYTQMIDPSNVGSTANLKQGSGVTLSSTYRNYSPGTPVETGQPLDLYIDGDGFFTVETSGGDVMYTRGGSFSISNEVNGRYMTTASGNYLLDNAGGRIKLAGDPDDISVTADGKLLAGGAAFAALQLVTFTNKEGLLLSGDGCYAATETTGPAKPSSAEIKQGYIESSNVDMSTELAQMIRAQRSFSLAGKALTAWNDMETVTNNLRA